MENPYASPKNESLGASRKEGMRLSLTSAVLIWVVSLSCKFAYEYALGAARLDKATGWLDVLIFAGHLSLVVASVMPIIMCGTISKQVRNFWGFLINVPALMIVAYVARMLR